MTTAPQPTVRSEQTDADPLGSGLYGAQDEAGRWWRTSAAAPDGLWLL